MKIPPYSQAALVFCSVLGCVLLPHLLNNSSALRPKEQARGRGQDCWETSLHILSLLHRNCEYQLFTKVQGVPGYTYCRKHTEFGDRQYAQHKRRATWYYFLPGGIYVITTWRVTNVWNRIVVISCPHSEIKIMKTIYSSLLPGTARLKKEQEEY